MSGKSGDDPNDDYYVSLAPTSHFNRFWEDMYKVSALGAFLSQSILDSDVIVKENGAFKSGLDALTYTDHLLFTKILDNFQSFVVDVICECIERNPKMIGPYTLKAEMLFQYDDIGELRRVAVEQMATKFSYLNIADLDEELRSRFGFPLFEKKFTKLKIRRLVEIRNAIVHTHGKKSSNFIKRVGAKFDKMGEEILIPHPAEVGDYVERIAENIDKRAKSHFGLEPEDEQ